MNDIFLVISLEPGPASMSIKCICLLGSVAHILPSCACIKLRYIDLFNGLFRKIAEGVLHLRQRRRVAYPAPDVQCEFAVGDCYLKIVRFEWFTLSRGVFWGLGKGNSRAEHWTRDHGTDAILFMLTYWFTYVILYFYWN